MELKNLIPLLFLAGCLSQVQDPVDTPSDEEPLIGCPFVKSNILNYAARYYSWPPDARGSDCLLVAIDSGSSYICSNSTSNDLRYRQIFIPRQVSSCTMHFQFRYCNVGTSWCEGQTWWPAQCSGYSNEYDSECGLTSKF